MLADDHILFFDNDLLAEAVAIAEASTPFSAGRPHKSNENMLSRAGLSGVSIIGHARVGVSWGDSLRTAFPPHSFTTFAFHTSPCRLRTCRMYTPRSNAESSTWSSTTAPLATVRPCRSVSV